MADEWLERVNQALVRYDSNAWTVRDVAEALRPPQVSPEPEWEYGRTVEDRVEVWRLREDAEHWARQWGGTVMRRTRSISPGPWEQAPVSEVTMDGKVAVWLANALAVEKADRSGQGMTPGDWLARARREVS